MRLSTRNPLAGTVTAIDPGSVMSTVTALVTSTAVMLAVDD
jgi:molybdopterin-binding protein